MLRVKILIVINDYLNASNGMCISTQRFVEEFRAAGHEVRIATNDRYGALDYPLGVVRIPVFSGIIEKEGFTFARADMHVIRQAVAWADIVHVEDPFLVCRLAARQARRMGKPVTGTFHLYPENMTYAVHLGSSHLINGGFMHSFVSGVYDRCLHVQCPTVQVRDRLAAAGAKAKLDVISNGIAQEFIDAGRQRMERQASAQAGGTCGENASAAVHGSAEIGGTCAGRLDWPGDGGDMHAPDVVRGDAGLPLSVLSVGRYAPEKNQALLLDAVAHAKHGGQMRVTLAGKGPIEDELREHARELGLSVDFGFHEQDDLRRLMCASDVYVHCADVEVEGMSCMEAFACGCVPVISDAALSSTKAYALTSHNLFAAGDAAELADRLDWLFEHRDELSALQGRYVEFADGLSVHACTAQVLAMMGQAREEVRAARQLAEGCRGSAPRAVSRRLSIRLGRHGDGR